MRVTFVALLAACLVLGFAAGSARAADPSSTVEAKRSAGCKTALDVIASQNPNLPMHPVFQEILNSPSLKGTLFVPTARAWEDFFATVRQRHGNPEAPAMVTRYGQVMLYHLAKDINVPIATPTPGAPRFAFDTASTLQCSVGPSLPNNRIIVKKTPQAIYLQHGTGNATIMSQPISYCGGEAYLVDQVLVPCSDVAAIMGEIANVPNPCRNNVEGVLYRDQLSYYNALLLATGVNRPIFAAVRNYTLFVPTDAAIQSAYESGAFNYPELFATNKSQLAGIVAYHAVPQVAYTAPSRATLSMETLLSQGQGAASCASNSLSWRPDGFVYGGTGAAKLGNTYDRGCAATIFQIDTLLQPCCRPMAELASSFKATEGSPAARAISMLKDKLKDGKSARSTFIMPSEAAWAALGDEVFAATNKSLTPEQLDAIVSYLYTGAEVGDVVETASPVRTELSISGLKLQSSLCPKGTNATVIFAYDKAADAPEATADAGTPAAQGAVVMPGSVGVQQLVAGRRLSETKLPTSASSASLLLPTTFNLGRRRDGSNILTGPVMVVDGAAVQIGAPTGIPVSSITYACDGSIYHVDAVPLPCNFLKRKAVVRTVAAPLRAAPVNYNISAALVNTSDLAITPNMTVPTSGAAAGVATLLGSGVAAALLAALLL